MKTILKIVGISFLILLIGLLSWFFFNMKDQDPGYKADLKVLSPEISPLKAGFAAVSITPQVRDKWIDSDSDAKYRPRQGDTYIDGNGNGKFDPVWISGFGNARAANGIHDDLWARTIVIDDGKTRLAIVVLDVIGFMNNNVIDVRKRIPADAGITYTMVVSTHVHEGPDLLGLWGKSPFKSGVDMDYVEFIKSRIIESVISAVENIRPCILEISEDHDGANHLVTDSRNPEIYDSGLRIIKFTDRENANTLGSLIAWADHPETLWGKNLLITSDFPHYLREGIEKGVYNGMERVKQGTGGVAVYVNGAIGGLMTTDPDLPVSDPFSDREFNEPTFEKAEAQGEQLALIALNAMDNPAERIDSAGISLIVRTLSLPVYNKLFKLGLLLDIFKRGTSGWMKMRTEVAVFKIGPVSFATFPGEVYPEIVNGKSEAPEGQDFNIEPAEVPPVREMMPGKYKFILGLANDEIGYIIPKSQWDEKSPYTYEYNEAPYGEENSLGPETAPILYRNLKEMLNEFNN